MPSIAKYMYLSVAHLDGATRRLLDAAALDALARMAHARQLPHDVNLDRYLATDRSAAASICVHANETGWISYVHEDLDELAAIGVPPTLLDIYRLANQVGTDYIHFTEDGPIDHRLPEFACPA